VWFSFDDPFAPIPKIIFFFLVDSLNEWDGDCVSEWKISELLLYIWWIFIRFDIKREMWSSADWISLGKRSLLRLWLTSRLGLK